MEADWQLIYAKKEISRSRVISDDPDLYASLFRNVSVFKRYDQKKSIFNFMSWLYFYSSPNERLFCL